MVYKTFQALDTHFAFIIFPAHNSRTNQPFLRLWNDLIKCEKLERDFWGA